jgi:hypothetical protein
MEDSHDSWSTRKPDRSPQKAVQGCHTLVPAQAACQRSRIVVRDVGESVSQYCFKLDISQYAQVEVNNEVVSPRQPIPAQAASQRSRIVVRVT